MFGIGIVPGGRADNEHLDSGRRETRDLRCTGSSPGISTSPASLMAPEAGRENDHCESRLEIMDAAGGRFLFDERGSARDVKGTHTLQ